MRIRIGHRPEDWTENVPANGATGPSRPSGALVTGGPGPNDKDVHRAQAAKSKAKAA